MDTKLHVSFLLSDEARQSRFVATGEMPERKQTIDLDMTAATPEQRQAIAAICGTDLVIEIGEWKCYETLIDPMPHMEQIPLKAVPDLDAVLIHGLRMQAEKLAAQAEYDAYCRQECEVDLAKKIQNLQDYLAQQSIHNDYDTELWRYELVQHGKRLHMDRSEYDAVREKYDAMVSIRKSEIEAELKIDEERKRIEAEQAAAARLEWISANGSEYLRRAVAAGYNCKRKYLVERAVLEYPGFTVDVEDAAEWRSRSCPSTEALDEQDALLAAHTGITVDIVWLTAPASDHKTDSERDEFDEEQSEPCEAIVVNDPIYGKYDLVK